MASIRRTLSPVPRPGIALNGELCSVGSPLSRLSACSQAQSNSPLSSSLDPQAFVFGVFSPKTLRPVEKLKQKGHLWRRAIFQFFLCFAVGVFAGFTPFSSMNLPANFIRERRAFSLEMVSAIGNLQTFDSSVSAVENVTLNSPTPVNFSQLSLRELDLESRKLLIIVTPTHARPFQAYYLNQLAQTLKLVPPPLLWIVVEMASQSPETADLLRKTRVMYRHLVCNVNLTDHGDRSVHQHNAALAHVEAHNLDGILYFADEDNIYSVELFDQMRLTRRFGIWPVAKVAEKKRHAAFEGPVCNGTEVIGWHVSEPKQRYQRFHTEMSGFAFNSTILWDPKRWHKPMLEPIRQRDTVKDGLRVSTFIHQIVEDESQMEGLGNGCSKNMVWRLPLVSSNSVYPHEWLLKDHLDADASLAS